MILPSKLGYKSVELNNHVLEAPNLYVKENGSSSSLEICIFI